MKANRVEDIWLRIEKRGPNDCWPYRGSTFGGRYGRFFLGRKAVLAHRVVCQLTYGESELPVLHKCNNKLCCNPSHLMYGTPSDNARHAVVSEAFHAGETGIVGISFIKKRGYWSAQGWRDGKRINLYTGPHKHKAIAARKKWVEEYGLNLSKEINQ